MSKDTLPFSDTDYSKLSFRVFPTLRRRDKYGSVGEVNEIKKGPKGERVTIGKAQIVAKETKTLDELSTPFLCFDTESKHWDEAYQRLNRFYRKPIEPDEELTIYWNRWVDND